MTGAPLDARSADRSTTERPFVIDDRPSAADQRDLTFAAWLVGVLDRWRLIAAIVGAVIVAAIAAMLLLKPVYRSQVSFLALSSSRLGNLSSIPGELVGVAAQFGLGQGADPGTSPAFYVELLGSRDMLTQLVTTRYPDPRKGKEGDSANLVVLLGPRRQAPRRALESTIKSVAKDIRVTSDTRTNLVAVTVDTPWPTLSQAVANRTLALVGEFNVSKRQSRARDRRVFLESRVRDSKADLTQAEDQLRDFYERNRAWQQAPSRVVEEARLRRQTQVASEIYLSLRRDYESARIDEVNDQPVVTVVDSAVAPVRREWPHPVSVVAVGLLIGLILGILIAGTLTLVAHWAQREPESAQDLASAWTRVRSQARALALLRVTARRRRTVDSNGAPTGLP